jgi:hypothetical protein
MPSRICSLSVGSLKTSSMTEKTWQPSKKFVELQLAESLRQLRVSEPV